MVNFQQFNFKLWFIGITLLFIGFNKSEAKLLAKITVAASVREPFITFKTKNDEPKGLDVTILKEFAKKVNISMEFIKIDKKLNEIISSDEQLNDFLNNLNLP